MPDWDHSHDAISLTVKQPDLLGAAWRDGITGRDFFLSLPKIDCNMLFDN